MTAFRMLLWLAALALLSGPAAAQQGAPVNTPPGYVWTYLGPTYGASWMPPGGIDRIQFNQRDSGVKPAPYNYNYIKIIDETNVGVNQQKAGFLVEVKTTYQTVGNVLGTNSEVELVTPSGNTPRGGYYVAHGTNAKCSSGDGGARSTVNGTFSAGAAAVTVASAAGFLVGDFVNVMLDAVGTPYTAGYIPPVPLSTVISGAIAGNSIPISPPIPAGRQTSTGKVVMAGKGICEGAILQAQAGPGGTNLYALVGAATATYTQTGASVWSKFGLSLENDQPAEVAALGFDAMVSMSSMSGAAPAHVGILLGDHLGGRPLDNFGKIIQAGGTSQFRQQYADFADLNGADFVGDIIAWSNRRYYISGSSGEARFGQVIADSTGGPSGIGFMARSISPNIAFQDTTNPVSSVPQQYQRLNANSGVGRYVWQVNTAAAGDYSTFLNSMTFEADGKIGFLQGIKVGSGLADTGATCSGAPTASFRTNLGIVVAC